MEIINLNLIPGLNNPVCHVSQFDVGRTIRLNLFEGGASYTLSGSEVLYLIVRKPDNKTLERLVVNTSSNYVTFNTTEQMCPLPGKNICELKITNSGNAIKSVNFLMIVEEDPLYNGVEEQSEIKNLDSQIEERIKEMDLGWGLISHYIDIKTAIYS